MYAGNLIEMKMDLEGETWEQVTNQRSHHVRVHSHHDHKEYTKLMHSFYEELLK